MDKRTRLCTYIIGDELLYFNECEVSNIGWVIKDMKIWNPIIIWRIKIKMTISC
jgi:hypothetical protein